MRQTTTAGSARAVVFIAGTYVYFLIFAQFGFLKRLNQLGIGDRSLTPVMAAMTLGGIFASLFAQRLLRGFHVATRLRAGFLFCALAALLSLAPLQSPGAACVALLIGLSLGLLTVTLVAHLRLWTQPDSALVTVALGTGLGYFLCNVPWLFGGTPLRTAAISAGGCLLAAALVNEPRPVDQPRIDEADTEASAPPSLLPFWSILLGFTALIWLDSAAFFIIQNSPMLKAGTWQGNVHLWTNGAIHLSAALASAWLIRRRGMRTTLLAAFCFIATACLLLHQPSGALLASLFYPAGVSLYSVALVAYPSLLLPGRSTAQREQRAGLIYAIAGWLGSAMGIGMGQHLHRVPTTFVVLAGIAMAASFFPRRLLANKAPTAAVVGLLLVALLLQRRMLKPPVPSTPETAVAQGRQVYIAEGCIHCHSQYVRPRNSADVTMWGPGSDVEAVRKQQPPLIGNRRQGPDLSEVGGRRSPLWLRIHFMNPRDVSPRSIMPRYNYLFEDRRGDALIAYMQSLKSPSDSSHLREMLASWTPQENTTSIPPDAGSVIFAGNCATCHLPGGVARTKWAASFHQLPPDLFAKALPRLQETTPFAQQTLQLERIIKFGIPGTDMPGHEYLPDTQIVTLAHWIMLKRQRLAASS